MKQKVITILILLMFNIKAFSQEYFPLLNNSAWMVLVSDFDGTETKYYSEIGESIIGNYTYKRYVSLTNEEYLLRENLDEKKVYKLLNGNDVLLYDFSLQVSDNITLVDGENYQVQSITNINVVGGQRRQFYLRNINSPWLDEYWIEGVGRSTHPLLAKNEFFTDPEYYLLCSYQDGGLNIFNYGIANGGSTNNCTLSIGEQYNSSKKIGFAPNPFDNELIITSETDLSKSTIRLFNSIGQNVREIRNISGKRYVLKRENLNSGLYVAKIFENGKEIAAKKLVIN